MNPIASPHTQRPQGPQRLQRPRRAAVLALAATLTLAAGLAGHAAPPAAANATSLTASAAPTIPTTHPATSHSVARVTASGASSGQVAAAKVAVTEPLSHSLPKTATPAKERTYLKALKVRHSNPGGYKRSYFKTWEEADEWGWSRVTDPDCNVREATLMRDGTKVKVNTSCKVLSGHWFDPYSGATFQKASRLDIDHMVPLADAWRSGANKWSAAKREKYANNPEVVVVSSASQNRSKGDDSPASWKPADHASWCGYAVRWIAVKHTWRLSVTSAEKKALASMLDTCPAGGKVASRTGHIASVTVVKGAGSASATSGESSKSSGSGGSAPDANSGTTYYKNCAAVRAAGKAPLLRGQPGYAAKLDRDGDGIACE
ncbi:MAG: excalibur calcium-binding domain-containing protein [Bifidobacteriaceae bacterium]|jgi:hypothetical protein|nr:excalibur calcium-binding domain-containing protein [Bifidobacteriaceae bacterium]